MTIVKKKKVSKVKIPKASVEFTFDGAGMILVSVKATKDAGRLEELAKAAGMLLQKDAYSAGMVLVEVAGQHIMAKPIQQSIVAVRGEWDR